MIKVTQQQRDNLLDALHNMWPSVPPENVMKNLRSFREGLNDKPVSCKTVACFGGWCAAWPRFAEQGIEVNSFGVPFTRDSIGTDLAKELFGDGLFVLRGRHKADEGFLGNDHQLVTHRMQWLLDNSEVEA